MSKVPRVVLMAAAGLLFIGATADGAVRKCQWTPNGLPVANKAPVLVLDGAIVGVMNMQEGTVGPSNAALDLESLDIVGMSVGCIEIEEAGRMVGRSTVAVVTRGGAVRVMTSYLTELVQAQRTFHAANGHYTRDLSVLPFFASRPQFPIEITAAEGRWRATLRFDGLATSCQVSWTAMSADEADSPAAGVFCR